MRYIAVLILLLACGDRMTEQDPRDARVDQGVPDRGMPDRGMPDRGMPDRGIPDLDIPDIGVDPPPEDEISAQILEGGREGALAPELSAACPDTQWVGYMLEGVNCPVAGGDWTTHKLVPVGFGGHQPLQPYCIYTWNSPAPEEAADIEDLPDVPSMRLERDCDVVTPVASGFFTSSEVADRLVKNTATQLGLLPQDFVVNGTPETVRIGVIDTAADTGDGLPDFGFNGHGYAVSSLIYRTGCLNPDTCIASVRGQVGLGREGVRDDNMPGAINWNIEGGDYGTQAEVAKAVYTSVVQWQTEGTEQHLILNLSLGWDARYGVRREELRVPALMAQDVLRWAACEGALIIAAAGNRAQIDAEEQDPMAPAAWEQDRDVCGTPGRYSPVVHAVSAVDGSDQPLATTRPLGQPRLMAPGAFMPTISDGGNPPYIRLHSGSSMATAAVSGIAALIWSVNPDLSRDGVMDIVYGSGVASPDNATFWLEDQQQPRVRVSACHAVAAACTNGCLLDTAPDCTEIRPFGDSAEPSWPELIDLMGWSNLPANADAQLSESNAAISDLLEPWATPQPGPDGCPLCGLFGHQMYGATILPPGAGDWAIGNVTVKFASPDDCPTKVYKAPGEVLAGLSFKTTLDLPENCTAKSAALELISTKNYVSSSELFVEK